MRSTQLVLRAFGARGLARRAAYDAQLRLGVLKKRLPTAPDFAGFPQVSWSHRFDLDEIRRSYEEEGIGDLVRDQVVGETKRVLDGQLQLYGDRWHDVGWPPRWHTNPFTGYSYPKDHWTQISDDAPECGDIKDVWELSRLPFTYLFARAYVLTGDDRFVEAWWRAIEDWAEHNSPNTGVNWRCGQETSLRGIALCFGLSVFAEHAASTQRRLDLAARLLGASVERVRPTVGYALSQRNNHAISELVFLLSVRSDGERQLLRLLLEVLADQFYPDGSYSQQSFTYQRLAVQALQWLLLTRPDLPPGVRSRVIDALARSRDFLSRCSDPVSGWLPNYGANDGALLFHLDTAHYRDFRPFLASLGHSVGPAQRETAIWLRLPEVASHATDANVQPTTYQTLRGERSLLLSRVGAGRHRAGHGDQQAIDLWIDGHNVVTDPGTYRYTASEPWNNALTGPEVHPTLRAPDEITLSLGRFLNEGMPPSKLVSHTESQGMELLVSRRRADDGSLWRVVARDGDSYAVADAAVGASAVARWNLQPHDGVSSDWSPCEPRPVGPTDATDPASGWHSLTYGNREAVEALESTIPSDTVHVAWFTPQDGTPVQVGALVAVLAGNVPTSMTRQLNDRHRAGVQAGEA